jgi:hypothetical protein
MHFIFAVLSANNLSAIWLRSRVSSYDDNLKSSLMQGYATRCDSTLDQRKEVCLHFSPFFIVLKWFEIFNVTLRY